jgi:hypothetical protein
MKGRVWIAALALSLTLSLGGASAPAVLDQVTPGLWEFTGARDAPARKVCISKPPLIARVEHQSGNCTHTIVRNDAGTAIVDYTCPGAGFGESKITMVTPRAMRVETQGIADNAPFAYVVQARRVGSCQAH